MRRPWRTRSRTRSRPPAARPSPSSRPMPERASPRSWDGSCRHDRRPRGRSPARDRRRPEPALHWPAPGGTLAQRAMQVRVNIRKTKGLIWLLGAGAFVFAGWTFYDIFTQKQAKHYDARSSSYVKKEGLQRNVPDQPVSTRKPFYPKDDYEKLWDCLIDGTVRPPVVTNQPIEQAEKSKPQALPIDTIVQIGLIV